MQEIVSAALVDNIVYCSKVGVLSEKTLTDAGIQERNFTHVELQKISNALCNADPEPATLHDVQKVHTLVVLERF